METTTETTQGQGKPSRPNHRKLTVRLAPKDWTRLEALLAAKPAWARDRTPEAFVRGLVKGHLLVHEFSRAARARLRGEADGDRLRNDLGLAATSLREQTRRMIAGLTPRERAVLRLRFGKRTRPQRG
jgi:hypothetical protein